MALYFENWTWHHLHQKGTLPLSTNSYPCPGTSKSFPMKHPYPYSTQLPCYSPRNHYTSLSSNSSTSSKSKPPHPYKGKGKARQQKAKKSLDHAIDKAFDNLEQWQYNKDIAITFIDTYSQHDLNDEAIANMTEEPSQF